MPKSKLTVRDVATSYGIDLPQAIELIQAMNNTWSAIYSDVFDSLDPVEDRKIWRDMELEKGYIIAELTLDAGSYLMYGGKPLAWLDGWLQVKKGDLLALGEALWDAAP